MYKDKLREWGFMKNMKAKMAKTIMREISRRGNRPTEVLLHGRPVAVTRIEKAYRNRSRFASSGTPVSLLGRNTGDTTEGLVVRTPAGSMAPVPTPNRPVLNNIVPNPPVEQTWTPSGAALVSMAHADQGPSEESHEVQPNDPPFLNDGRGLQLEELIEILTDACNSEAAGMLPEAESKFCIALSGFRHHFGPVDDITAWATVCLVRVHALQGHGREAAEVANWLSRKLCAARGLWHANTMRHYIDVASVLMDASRVSPLADVLGSRFLDALRNGADHCAAVLLPEDDTAVGYQGNGDGSSEQLDHVVLDQVFGATKSFVHLGQQIQLAELLLTCEVPGMIHVPEQLVDMSNGLGDEALRGGQNLRAWCLLIKQLHSRDARTQASEKCALARRALERAMGGIEGSGLAVSEELLGASRELAFLHYALGDRRRCEKVLGWVAGQLERAVYTVNEQKFKHFLLTTGYELHAGMEYRQLSDTAGAATWFETAYGYSTRLLGPDSDVAKSLARIVDKGKYPKQHLDALLLRLPMRDSVPRSPGAVIAFSDRQTASRRGHTSIPDVFELVASLIVGGTR
ncbi:hypothetical protein ACHAQA_005541 [Verticillium albo-atrum]